MFKRFIVIGLLAALTALPLYGQSKGGRWQMEGSGEDSAWWDAAADNGALQGAAAWSTQAPIPEGSGLLWLDSANQHDFLKIEDSSDLDFENENVGISMWIYPTVLNDVHFLVNKGTQTDATKSTCYALRISLAKKIEFLIRDSNNKAQTAASGFTVPLNQWTFVAAFYDYAAGKVYFWDRVAAAPTDSVAFRFNYLVNDGPLSIGSWYRNDPAAPSIKDFEGGMDDVRLSGRREDLLPLATAVATADPSTAVQPQDLRVWPNPASAVRHDFLTIAGTAAMTGPTELTLFNIRGQVVRQQVAGRWPLQWPLRDARGSRLPAGQYLLQIKDFNGIRCQRVTILR